MTVHVHELTGCSAAPLAHYLKALAILRLVAEQADPSARGWWKNDSYHLATVLGEDALIAFFCERYCPTPILSPWNGGSGFHEGDNTSGISAIRGSTAERFAVYRAAIAHASGQVTRSESREKGDEKTGFIAACFASWPPEGLAWLSAAVAPGVGKTEYPALLGTGGNDGRLDFSNNFMQRLLDLFGPDGAPSDVSRDWLGSALFGRTHKGLLGDKAIGQFFPGAAGGANGTAGFDAKSLINPWDFVLMLEGAIVLRVGALRKLDGAELPRAAAPFALRASNQGYGSAAEGDDSTRGEQWMPLWSRPATKAEVDALFAEGRLNGGGRAAQNPLDAARAVARLGVARGVTTFTRFGYLVRNGLSNLAVPLGTFRVDAAPNVRLLDEIDDWLRRYRYAADSKTAPASFERSCRRIERYALAVCQSGEHAATRASWEALVVALGQAEHELVRRAKATADAHLQPLPMLSPRWFEAVNDWSPEMRLALAIASQRGPRQRDDLGPIRVHCMPLDASTRYRRFVTSAEGLRRDRRVVWGGRDLVSDLIAIAERRAVEGHAGGHSTFPLVGSESATLSDVRAFLEGAVDEARVSDLARGFMALDFSEPILHEAEARLDANDVDAHTRERRLGLPLHALTRLCYWPRSGEREFTPRYEPTALRQLANGRLEEAVRTMSMRLVGMGLRPKIRFAVGDASFARRLAASVAVPVAARDLRKLHSLVTKPFADPSENRRSAHEH